mmetsp:Transcript_15539/g.35575  ORF Transcript_15539/g.35575 Transcript_15539/m.35575 type:complete len:488 (+) Transcript_15539:78-1541(+)
MANKTTTQQESSREKAVELIATMLMQKGGTLVEQARKKAEAGESLQIKGVKVDAEMLKEALLRSGALLKHDAPKAVTSAAPSARWSPAKEATSSSRWRPAAASDMMLSSRALEECEQAEVFVRTVEVVSASDVRVFPKPDVLQPPLKVQLGSGQAAVIARWYCHKDGRLYLRFKDPEGWVSTRSVHDMTAVVISPLSGESAVEPPHCAVDFPSTAVDLLPHVDDTGEHRALGSMSVAGGETIEGGAEYNEQEAEDIGEQGGEDEEEGDEDEEEGEEGEEEEEAEGDEEVGEDAPSKEPGASQGKRAPSCRFRVASTGRCYVLPYPGAAAAKQKGLPALAAKQTIDADAVAFVRSEQRAYVRLVSGKGWVCERSLGDIRRYAVVPVRKNKKPVTKKQAKALAFKGYDTGGATKLTKDDLTKNKHGKVVSKRASEASKKRFAESSFGKWTEAVKRARIDLGIVGFAAAKKGSPLYDKAQEYYKEGSSKA